MNIDPLMVRKAIRDRDLQSLLERKKLHLVLDLDHTLLHAESKPSLTLHHKQLMIITNPKNNLHEIGNGAFVVKFRPGLDVFLKEVRTMFVLSIFTMGSRPYAKLIKDSLEGFVGDHNNNKLRFRHVLSREDCVIKHKKSLDLVSSHERLTLIVDDTEDVWKNPSHNEENLVRIAPYVFFPCSRGEPSVMDEELARVLKILKSVYDAFYDGEDNGADRDVREVLKLVRGRGCGDHEDNEVKKVNLKRSCEVAFDYVPTVVDAMRNKVCDNSLDPLMSFPCLAC